MWSTLNLDLESRSRLDLESSLDVDVEWLLSVRLKLNPARLMTWPTALALSKPIESSHSWRRTCVKWESTILITTPLSRSSFDWLTLIIKCFRATNRVLWHLFVCSFAFIFCFLYWYLSIYCLNTCRSLKKWTRASSIAWIDESTPYFFDRTPIRPLGPRPK